MSGDFKVAVSVSGWVPGGIGAAVFPALAEAVAAIAQAGVTIWRGYAEGAPLPSGKQIHGRSGAYARSIRAEPGAGVYSATVLSDAPYAAAIEYGTPARDLKTMLDTSPKVRIVHKGPRKGKRYLIIPFRHGTPGTVGFSSVMTPDVYQVARALTPSRITGQWRERSGLNASDTSTRGPLMVTRRTYRWGGRLSAAQLRAAGARGSALRNQTGMVHMQNPSATGGSKHGQYLTFRVMSEGSRGWMSPGTADYHPAEAMSHQLQPLAEQAFKLAVERDVRTYLGLGSAGP